MALRAEARRLTTTLAVAYSISATLGSGPLVSEQVTTIDTATFDSSLAGDLNAVAEANPAIADLAGAQPMLLSTEPASLSLFIQYNVVVLAGKGREIGTQLSTMDGRTFAKTLTTNMKAADPSLESAAESLLFSALSIETRLSRLRQSHLFKSRSP